MERLRGLGTFHYLQWFSVAASSQISRTIDPHLYRMKQIWISHWDSLQMRSKWQDKVCFTSQHCLLLTRYHLLGVSKLLTLVSCHLPSSHLRNFKIRFPNKGFFFVYYFKILYFLSKPKILPWVTFIALLGHMTLQPRSWTHLELESMLYILYGLTQLWKKKSSFIQKTVFPPRFLRSMFSLHHGTPFSKQRRLSYSLPT